MTHLRMQFRRQITRKNFIPSSLGLEGARLEALALTAPAIFRYPNGDTRQNDHADAWVISGILFNTPTVPDDSEAEAQLNGITDSDIPYGGDTTITVNGYAATEIHDLENPAPPNAPVGNDWICFNTNNTVESSTTGTGLNGAFVAMDSYSSGSRNYLIADDDLVPSSSPVTVVEHYEFHVDRSQQNDATAGISTTTGLNVEITGDYVLILGTQWGPGSHSFTDTEGNGAEYTLEISNVGGYIADVDLVVETNVGELMTLKNPTTGDFQGFHYNISFYSQLHTIMGSHPGVHDVVSVTTHFDAHLSS
ncbi:hypothetical protein V5E97_20735 [Singulisphaera sp. Ch08]|uniref:Uncharacterized protein n=1 Tax=Singulisphaera sp. Ch08 TaxID=3120278 RepID=A0AAU7C6N9_9BACT